MVVSDCDDCTLDAVLNENNALNKYVIDNSVSAHSLVSRLQNKYITYQNQSTWIWYVLGIHRSVLSQKLILVETGNGYTASQSSIRRYIRGLIETYDP
jgi:hypothetical protein